MSRSLIEVRFLSVLGGYLRPCVRDREDTVPGPYSLCLQYVLAFLLSRLQKLINNLRFTPDYTLMSLWSSTSVLPPNVGEDPRRGHLEVGRRRPLTVRGRPETTRRSQPSTVWEEGGPVSALGTPTFFTFLFRETFPPSPLIGLQSNNLLWLRPLSHPSDSFGVRGCGPRIPDVFWFHLVLLSLWGRGMVGRSFVVHYSYQTTTFLSVLILLGGVSPRSWVTSRF